MNIEKILIIDDEPLCAKGLKRKILEIDSSFEIKVCHKPAQSIDCIKHFRPELLFLDIAMPGLSGFDLLDQLEPGDQLFVLVFCTAYNEHALKAFEKNALDYIVKPVEPLRLKETLAKAKRAAAGSWLAVDKDLNPQKFMQKIVVKLAGQVSWLDPGEVAYFASEHHETIVKTLDRQEYFCALSLATLEARLDPRLFFRCHRGYLVNLNKVTRFDLTNKQIYIVNQPRPVPLSRRAKSDFKLKINGLAKI